MIWTKNLTLAENWCVWHYNLDSGGGSQRANYFLRLNDTAAEGYNNAVYGGNPLMLPTSTCWQVGNNDMINNNNNEYISMAFASVEGVCKVGAYDGTGSAGHVITTGFLPRLLLIKTTNASNSWFLYDAVRGLGAGNDPYMQLENTNAQAGGDTFATSSTGFTINQSYSSVNASGQKYIYYAHA